MSRLSVVTQVGAEPWAIQPKDAEHLAETFLAHDTVVEYWPRDRLPEVWARDRGVDAHGAERTDLDFRGYSASTKARGPFVTVVVDDTESYESALFVLCHELAHLHAPDYARRLTPDDPAFAHEEKRADAVAAMLMGQLGYDTKVYEAQSRRWWKRMFNPPEDNLALREIVEYGVEFSTGEPVTFPSMHNTESAPYLGSRYQQDIEPHGRYVLHAPRGYVETPGWEYDTTALESPLVLEMNTGPTASYDERSWKARLAEAFGETGLDLSQVLIEHGYDGIVTVESGPMGPRYTVEIVDLTVLPYYDQWLAR